MLNQHMEYRIISDLGLFRFLTVILSKILTSCRIIPAQIEFYLPISNTLFFPPKLTSLIRKMQNKNSSPSNEKCAIDQINEFLNLIGCFYRDQSDRTLEFCSLIELPNFLDFGIFSAICTNLAKTNNLAKTESINQKSDYYKMIWCFLNFALMPSI
jgi:hypothetical protein